MAYPLSGIKVLDMSRVLAGPFAGRMLSDLGADVVKLEPPEGDITRMWGPKEGGISGYFHQQNAGKRNISVDLRNARGASLVKALIQETDVLIENFRPDVMGRLGLDYDTLSAINPRLIMLSISGFGIDNPDSGRAAYAPVVHAETGLVSRQAMVSKAFPADIGVSIADTNASLHGLVGLLAALYARQSSGQGDHIDLAMVDATVVTNDGMNFALEGVKHGVLNEVYETSAGLLMLAGEFKYIWHQLSTICGVVDGLDSELPVSLEEKISVRRAATRQFFCEACKTRETVISALDRMNIAWGDVRPATDIRELACVQSRGTITDVDNRQGGTRPTTQSPYRYRHLESQVRAGAPYLGEHNATVLAEWLSWTEREIAEYSDVLIAQGSAE